MVRIIAYSAITLKEVVLAISTDQLLAILPCKYGNTKTSI